MTKSGLRPRPRIIVPNLILFAILYGLVLLNKKVVRPAFHDVPSLNLLTGCFPNFLAALMISLCVVNAVAVARPRYGRFLVYAGSLLVFVILTVEELKPMWGASTYYDPFDIVASGVGSLLAIAVYELIVLKRRTGCTESLQHGTEPKKQ